MRTGHYKVKETEGQTAGVNPTVANFKQYTNITSLIIIVFAFCRNIYFCGVACNNYS